MNEFKGIPGPWKFEAAGHRGSDGPTGFRVLPAAMRYVIAELFDYGPEGEANAALIAAAPELLEALQGILDQVAIEEETERFSIELEALHERGRFAIAKALGQEVPS